MGWRRFDGWKGLDLAWLIDDRQASGVGRLTVVLAKLCGSHGWVGRVRGVFLRSGVHSSEAARSTILKAGDGIFPGQRKQI